MASQAAPPETSPCSVATAGTSRALQKPKNLICNTSIAIALNRHQNKLNRLNNG